MHFINDPHFYGGFYYVLVKYGTSASNFLGDFEDHFHPGFIRMYLKKSLSRTYLIRLSVRHYSTKNNINFDELIRGHLVFQ